MYTVPPSKGIQAKSFTLYEITTGGEKTFHAYTTFYGGDWRFSTAVQEITLVLDTWHWKTKSGSEYSCNSYSSIFLHETFLDNLRLHFRGDTIRQVSEEEISNLFGE